MEKFEELNYDEEQQINGGLILVNPKFAYAVYQSISDFCEGFAENIGPAFERVRNNIKYGK